ncbi:MAG: hypothetical protein HZB80_03295 [Deltaproteobacteria bacterium]|nr:hypothetical protein [Deltaproteobacteria bacterium]
MTKAIKTITDEQELCRELEGAFEYGFYKGYAIAIEELGIRLEELLKDAEARMTKLKEDNSILQTIAFDVTMEVSHDNNQT